MKIKNITYLFLLLGVMLSGNAFAQYEKMIRVQECLKAKDIKGAKQAVDSVFLSKEAQTDAQAWYFRSFVYYELAKKDRATLISPARDSSVAYALKSIKLATDAELKQSCNEIIKRHATTYLNLRKILLQDSLKYERSYTAYSNYKKLNSMIDPNADYKAFDIEYFSAAGSIFTELFSNDNSKTEYGEVGKVALMKVLDLDPKNVSASFNLGVIYYNQGVNLINSMDIDTPLDKLESIQDNSVKLFKQSLPFMTKVYELDPKNVKALESLSRIYYALNDTEKANEFVAKLEQAKQGK